MTVIGSLVFLYVQFFKDKKINYTQYIPYLEPLKLKDAKKVLNPKNYGNFLKETFDYWYQDFLDGKYVSIRYFDNLVSTILNRGSEACDMNGTCSIQNIIEVDFRF